MPLLMFASGTSRTSPLLQTPPPHFSLHQQILLERLPTVGDVTVKRGAAPSGFSVGFTWTITFETQMHDIESIVVNGNITAVPIVGPNAHLEVVEVRRGVAPSLDVTVTGLDPDEAYFTRISAFNADGFGPTTLAVSGDGGARGGNVAGLGVSPLAVIAHTAPKAPVISHISAVSASQLEVVLEDSPPSGVDPLGFKVRAEKNTAQTRNHMHPQTELLVSSAIYRGVLSRIHDISVDVSAMRRASTPTLFACRFSTVIL